MVKISKAAKGVETNADDIIDAVKNEDVAQDMSSAVVQEAKKEIKKRKGEAAAKVKPAAEKTVIKGNNPDEELFEELGFEYDGDLKDALQDSKKRSELANLLEKKKGWNQLDINDLLADYGARAYYSNEIDDSIKDYVKGQFKDYTHDKKAMNAMLTMQGKLNYLKEKKGLKFSELSPKEKENQIESLFNSWKKQDSLSTIQYENSTPIGEEAVEKFAVSSGGKFDESSKKALAGLPIGSFKHLKSVVNTLKKFTEGGYSKINNQTHGEFFSTLGEKMKPYLAKHFPELYKAGVAAEKKFKTKVTVDKAAGVKNNAVEQAAAAAPASAKAKKPAKKTNAKQTQANVKQSELNETQQKMVDAATEEQATVKEKAPAKKRGRSKKEELVEQASEEKPSAKAAPKNDNRIQDDTTIQNDSRVGDEGTNIKVEKPTDNSKVDDGEPEKIIEEKNVNGKRKRYISLPAAAAGGLGLFGLGSAAGAAFSGNDDDEELKRALAAQMMLRR